MGVKGVAKWRNRTNLPVFSSGDFYSYFQDLLTPTRYPHIDRVKQAIFRNASYYFSSSVYDELATEAGQAPETIIAAIDFLNLVATNERQKEIAAVERYLKDMYNDIPEIFRKNKEFEQIIANLKTFSQGLSTNSFDKNATEQFYIELITYINMIRRNIDEFKNRLAQIKNNNITTWEQLTERSMLFRAEGDLNSLIKSTLGIQQRGVKDSFSSKIREQAFDFLEKNGLGSNLNLQNNLLGILSGIVVELEHYIETKKQPNEDMTKIENLETIIQDYFNQEDAFFLKEVKKLLSTGDISRQLDMVIKGLESSLGIKYNSLGKNSNTFKERQKLIDKQLISNNRGAKSGERNYIAKRLKAMGLTNILNNYQTVTWTVRAGKNAKKPLAGLIYEGIAPILEGGQGSRVGGSGATDTILCSIIGTFKSEQDNDLITNKFNQIIQALQADYLGQREDRFSDLSKNTKQINADIDQLIKELEDETKNLKVPENDLFIYHESLKLYGTMEQTENGSRRASSFHGRDMQALNMLDDLYSIADLDEVKLLDKDALKGVLLNLSDLAAAGFMRPTVENYFSIFAGMLMFSDIRNMALEVAKSAQQQVSYSSTKNIHLYLLNDTYYPASLILTQVYQALSSGVNSISVKDGIKAKINVKEATRSIASYVASLQAARDLGLPSPYDPEDWDIMAEIVSAGTKIQLSFLSSFLNFTENIANKLSIK